MFRNKSKLDLLLVSERKLDDSFPTVQFLMSCMCKTYILYRCSNGIDLLIYIREDMPSRLLTEYEPPRNLECLFVEINVRKKKCLLCCSYNSHKNNISSHLHHLNKDLNVYLKYYDNLLILRNLETFNEKLFRTELDKGLAKIDLNHAELAEFQSEFLSVLNKHAPVIYKYVRANNSSSVS